MKSKKIMIFSMVIAIIVIAISGYCIIVKKDNTNNVQNGENSKIETEKVQETPEVDSYSKVEFKNNECLAIAHVLDEDLENFQEKFFSSADNLKEYDFRSEYTKGTKEGDRFIIIPKNSEVLITVYDCFLNSNSEIELNNELLSNHKGAFMILDDYIEVVPHLCIKFKYKNIEKQFYIQFSGEDGRLYFDDVESEVKDISEVKEENSNYDQNLNEDFSDENNNQETSKKENSKNKVIVIDPGHQTKGNSEKEPIGPGATETKAKVTTGATGVSTGQKESELNLKVSLLLKEELTKKGYTVIMTRTVNDVNMSNSERAKIANNANADAFIRIHANSASSSSAKGVLTMCQTENNIYNGYLAQESYNLSKLVVDNIVKETGANNRNVTKTDTMSGINWCTVPTTIVEMGFLSNPDEDKLMATDEYQKKIVEGIVQGVEEYFENK